MEEDVRVVSLFHEEEETFLTPTPPSYQEGQMSFNSLVSHKKGYVVPRDPTLLKRVCAEQGVREDRVRPSTVLRSSLDRYESVS